MAEGDADYGVFVLTLGALDEDIISFHAHARAICSSTVLGRGYPWLCPLVGSSVGEVAQQREGDQNRRRDEEHGKDDEDEYRRHRAKRVRLSPIGASRPGHRYTLCTRSSYPTTPTPARSVIATYLGARALRVAPVRPFVGLGAP